MRYKGTVKGGVVIFDQEVPLREGERVEVEPVSSSVEAEQPQADNDSGTQPGDSGPLDAVRLAQLPIEQRRAILQTAAEALAQDYENDPELTAFTALDGEEFYEYGEEGRDLACAP